MEVKSTLKPFYSTMQTNDETHLSILSLKTLLPSQQIISCLAVKDNLLYAASLHQVDVFDRTTYALIDTFGHRDPPSSGLIKSIAFGGERRIFTAHQDCRIRVWQLKVKSSSKRHRLVSVLPTVLDRLSRCVSSKNYVPVRRHVTKLWVEHADAVTGLAVNDGLMYSASWDKGFKVWRMSDLRCLETVKAHSDAVNAVLVGGGSEVYTASADGTVKVWGKNKNGGSGHVLVDTLEKHESSVNALALNDDGSVLFSGGFDRRIFSWRRSNGGDRMVVESALGGHVGPVLSMIHVDGLLISGSSDRTVRIWGCDSTGGLYRCLAVLEGHSKPVKSLAAVGGGFRNGVVSIFSGSLNGEIRVWQVIGSTNPLENKENIPKTILHN